MLILCVLAFWKQDWTAMVLGLTFFGVMFSVQSYYVLTGSVHYGQPFWKVISIVEYNNKNQGYVYSTLSEREQLGTFIDIERAGKTEIRALVQTQTTLNTGKTADIILGPIDISYIGPTPFAELKKRVNKSLA